MEIGVARTSVTEQTQTGGERTQNKVAVLPRPAPGWVVTLPPMEQSPSASHSTDVANQLKQLKSLISRPRERFQRIGVDSSLQVTAISLLGWGCIVLNWTTGVVCVLTTQ